MKNELLVSDMLTMNTLARLWHWTTDNAQHHVTYEQFLTQNETFTDSFVESALGNDLEFQFQEVGVTNARIEKYDLQTSRENLKNYRQRVFEAKKFLEESESSANSELIAILDDVTELTSKTLYLLKLK